MATLTVQDCDTDGLDDAAIYESCAAGGDEFSNDGNTFVHVKNGSGGSIDVTFASQVSDPPAGTAAQDLSVSVGAGKNFFIGPFNQNAYNDADGKVQISYSDTTSLTIAAIKVVK